MNPSAASKRGGRSLEARTRRRAKFHVNRNLLRRLGKIERRAQAVELIRGSSPPRNSDEVGPAGANPGPGDLETATSPPDPRSNFSIGSLNCITLQARWRVREAVQLMIDLNIDVLLLQEHRRPASMAPPLLPMGFQFKFSPADDRSVGGIGAILSKRAADALLDVTFPTARHMVLTIQGDGRKIKLVNVYAPTSPSTQNTPALTEDFFDVLKGELANDASRNLFLLSGDFNATLPADGVVSKTSCGPANANTPFLRDFSSSNDLWAINGHLRHVPKSHATFHGPQNRHVRLDWMFTRTSQRFHFKRFRSIRLKALLSDHSLLVTDIDLAWHFTKPPSPRTYWPALRDPRNECLFQQAFFANLDGPLFENFEAAVNIAAEEVLPKMVGRQAGDPWMKDPRIEEARRALQSASARFGQDYVETKGAADRLRDLHTLVAEETAAQIVAEINDAALAGRHSAVWRAINRVTSRKARPHTVVAADSFDERKRLLAEHYATVLNTAPPGRPPPMEPPPGLVPSDPALFNTGPFTQAETVASLKNTRPDGAPGNDGIPARVLKLPGLIGPVTTMLNAHSPLTGGHAHELWRSSSIASIPKKGNSTALDNQRGISLMVTSAKLSNKELLDRLLPVIGPKLLTCQAGFLPDRSTTEQLASLRLIIDDCRKKQRNVSIVFIDFAKAFDSISRPTIALALRFHGVPEVLIEAVMDLYVETRARVKTSHGPTAEFATTSGVLQGDALAPFLFVVVLDMVLRRALDPADAYELQRKRSSRHLAKLMPFLAYADDIASLHPSPEAAQRSILRLETAARSVGLKIYARKTKVLHIGFPVPPPPPPSCTVRRAANCRLRRLHVLGGECDGPRPDNRGKETPRVDRRQKGRADLPLGREGRNKDQRLQVGGGIRPLLWPGADPHYRDSSEGPGRGSPRAPSLFPGDSVAGENLHRRSQRAHPTPPRVRRAP
jgi:hypothetical protein